MRKLYLLFFLLFLLQSNLISQLGWNQQQCGTTENLNAVFFINNKVGTVVGNNGTILRTTNGGETWENQSSGTNQNLGSLTYINENNIYVVGGSVVLHTTDGGV